MKRKIVLLSFIIVIVAVFSFGGCSKNNVRTVVFWHSYQGYQEQMFERIVKVYNETVGAQEGVRVIPEYAGKTDEINNKFNDAIDAQENSGMLPNIAVVSKETAYNAVKYDLITFAELYMTDEEINGYFSGFMEEGRLSMAANTYLFPLSKQIQQTIINDNMWKEFNQEYPQYSEQSFMYWESLIDMAAKYYDWTDAMTPDVHNDGRAFFAIESLETFIYTYTNQRVPSLIQSGYDEITINANKDTFSEIWNLYHKGVVQGYISTVSDITTALKKGDILCYVGTPGNTNYSSVYIDLHGNMAPLSIKAVQYPSVFANRIVVPHSGTGVVVVDKGEKSNKDAYNFIKWYTSNPNFIYICFAGYEVPSCVELASSENTLNEIAKLMDKNKQQYNMLVCEYNQVLTYTTYSPVAFNGSERLGRNITAYLQQASKNDKEKVKSHVKEGYTMDSAVSYVCSEMAFNAWFEGILNITEGIQ